MSQSIDKLRSRRSKKTKESDISEVFSSNFGRPTLSNIVIDEEFQSFIPPLTRDELLELEESIRKEHVRDALVLWQNGDDTYTLVDGHNRFGIIKKLNDDGLNVKFPTKILEFTDRDSVKDWMISNQLGRRNLTPEQGSYLRGLRYNREKTKHGGARKNSKPQNGDLSTSHRLALEYKVGKNTIERDGQYASGLEVIGSSNPELKKSILSGDTKLSKSIIQKLSKFEGKKISPINEVKDVKVLLTDKKVKAKNSQAKTPFDKKKDTLLTKIKNLTNASSSSDFQAIEKLVSELKKLSS